TPAPPFVGRDAFGTVVSMWLNNRATAYRLTCVPTEVYPRAYVAAYNLPQYMKPEKVRSLCLLLPKDKLDAEKLRGYAQDVLRRAGVERGSARAKARALEQHLATGFKYTLDAYRTPGVERVTDFLYNTREGHCEVFASALAVLLRTIDIPSRVVNGFRGGEYHSWTDTYTVLDKHAHAWVEALCEEGWVTLAATPPGALDDLERSGLLATLDDLKIWFEIRWFKNVVAFDTNDQYHLIRDLKDWLAPQIDKWREWAWWHSVRDRDDMKLMVAFLAAALVLGTTLATVGRKKIAAGIRALLAELREMLRPPTRAELAARELEPVLRALERLGVRRAPGETASDLAALARTKLGERALAFERVVPIYYEARY